MENVSELPTVSIVAPVSTTWITCPRSLTDSFDRSTSAIGVVSISSENVIIRTPVLSFRVADEKVGETASHDSVG